MTDQTTPKTENSGGKVDYYRVTIDCPNQAKEPYTAECSDIIEALGLTFNEGEEFKALWRTGAARTLGKLKAFDDALRNAEKRAHYSARDLALMQHALQGKSK